MKDKRILFVAANPNMAFCLLPILRKLRGLGMAFDVFVPAATAENPFAGGRNAAAEILLEEGIPVVRSIPAYKEYEIMYCENAVRYNGAINPIKYRVRLVCDAYGGNELRLYDQPAASFYDFILCACCQDASIFAAHGEARALGNIKLADYCATRKEACGQKTLLYLPSGGKDEALIEGLKALRGRYKIIVKMNCRSAFSPQEEEEPQHAWFDGFENIMGQNVSVGEALKQADVVLSGFSAAAFDAIAADVPMALFGLGEPRLFGGRLCLHQQVARDGVIPATDDVEALEEIIERAMTPEVFARQQKLKEEMFPYQGKECVEAFLRFQNDLLENRVDPWYIATRRSIYAKRGSMKNKIERAVKRKSREYTTSNSWKITRPYRAVARIIKRVIKRIKGVPKPPAGAGKGE